MVKGKEQGISASHPWLHMWRSHLQVASSLEDFCRLWSTERNIWCQVAISTTLWLYNYSAIIVIRISFQIRNHVRDRTGVGATHNLALISRKSCGVSVLFHVRWPPDPTCLFWWLLLAGPHSFFHFKYQVLHVASFMKIYAVIKKSKVHNLNCPWHPLLKYRDSPQPSARVRVLQADSFRKPESKQNLQPSWGGGVGLVCLFWTSWETSRLCVLDVHTNICFCVWWWLSPLSASWINHLRKVFCVCLRSQCEHCIISAWLCPEWDAWWGASLKTLPALRLKHP